MKKVFTKKLFFVLQTLFLTGIVAAQNCNDNAIYALDANNVRAYFQQGGTFWRNGDDAGYIVPKNATPQVASIFSGHIWMGGLNQNGQIISSMPTYGVSQGGASGPVVNGLSDNALCANFDRFWPVSQSEVQAHKNDFNDNGVIDNPIQNIIAWPGRNNPESMAANGFNLPDVILAPFWDLNANGIYEPMKGDYPAIKGDESVWWIFHTGEEDGNGLSPVMNVAVLAYASAASSEAINNATCYDVKLDYQGTVKLESFYVGLWVDADLGCYTDDFAGCEPEENLAFVYNADSQDGDVGCSCSAGSATFCDKIPVVGIKLLEGLLGDDNEPMDMSSFMVYNNSVVNNPAPGTTDPNTDTEYYRLISGYWRDGTSVTSSGSGYNTPGSPTKFMFPGNPSEDNEWSMCSANLPPNDTRLIMSFGSMTLWPGIINEFSFTVFSLPDQTYPCPDISNIIAAGQEIKEASHPLSPNETKVFVPQILLVSPNPAQDVVSFSTSDNSQIESLAVYAASGALLRNTKVDGVSHIDLARNGLAAGIYFFKAMLSNGKIATGKFVFN